MGTHDHCGSVAILAEIPVLQSMSALFMGNRPVVKVDERVSIVYEQFVRMLLDCGRYF